MGADIDILTEGIDRAIDELLAVRVALSDRPAALPEIALDEALRASSDYQDARRAFATAVEAAVEGAQHAQEAAILDAEAAAHSMVGTAVAAAWTLGLRVRAGAGEAT